MVHRYYPRDLRAKTRAKNRVVSSALARFPRRGSIGAVEYEQPGQFPSKDCECHFQEPYGFVPEAGCPTHDDNQFLEFMRFAERRAKQIEHRKCTVGCPLYSNNHSVDAGGNCNMGCC